jgi:DNA (cytosine-5)-methyltransferase 1
MDLAELNGQKISRLGTPQARDYKGRPGRQEDKNLNHDVARYDLLTNWGKFEPAIRRWEEVLDRDAPSPTKPDGKEGAHRLSSAFTEWLMGLPEGWVTDVGLTRNEELKACGNGVVPQQAATALRALLHGLPIASGGGK